MSQANVPSRIAFVIRWTGRGAALFFGALAILIWHYQHYDLPVYYPDYSPNDSVSIALGIASVTFLVIGETLARLIVGIAKRKQ